MEKTPYVSWDLIGDFMKCAFMKVGVPEKDAEICADVLMESDRRGIESHGCNRFKPIYIDRIVAGIQKPVTEIEILKETVVGTAVVMFVVACAGLYSWLGATVGLIDKVAGGLTSISTSPVVILLMINIILLFAGMLLDANSIFYVFLPILAPVIAHFGWNPIWFGIMATTNMAIGQVTPPVAVNLFVGARISGISMERIARPAIPLIIAAMAALVFITAFPEIALFLPRLMGML